jgi:hypothetical protein
MAREVLFVCPHGAGKSRMAAAFFNRVAPPGWHATSAGQEPDPAVSPDAVRLLAGTGAEALLDREPPRPIVAAPAPTRLVAIDCDVPGAERWDLRHQRVGDAMRDELRERAEALARAVATG